MKMLSAGLIVLGAACAAQADEITITQEGLTFNPASVTVSPGDVITWVRTGGTHDAVHGDGCFEASDDGGIFAGFPYFDLQLTASNPTATWTVPQAANGRIPYFCSVGNHCANGMEAEILVVPRAGSKVITIEQNGLDFTPENAVAAPGDTIVWNHNNGGHSVHTGSNADCSNDDVTIALPLDFVYDQVIWQIPDDQPEGIVDYFCIFHCELGHLGTIDIQSNCAVGDLNCDGSINGPDLTILLGSWGACIPDEDCPADLNNDGEVSGPDLTIMLGGWTG